MKKKPTPDGIALEILRELKADHYAFPDPLKAPPFQDVGDRVCKKFRGEVPQAVWNQAVMILDEGQCLKRAQQAQGENRMYVWISEAGLHSLAAYDEEIRETKPKTNWAMISALIALAALVATVLAVRHFLPP